MGGTVGGNVQARWGTRSSVQRWSDVAWGSAAVTLATKGEWKGRRVDGWKAAMVRRWYMGDTGGGTSVAPLQGGYEGTRG